MIRVESNTILKNNLAGMSGDDMYLTNTAGTLHMVGVTIVNPAAS